ncbi:MULTISPECIES: DUF3667 domain-containing protein [Croceitalea]|uniref:DUF3667 domain-containing protein n=1 Tax=Croceitalea vernalis TaxID=3075599 RepID=A0ABU3BGG5_9FLAO|nr:MULTISPECIES: DUF3667 domain-containing protein [unclassified Croceitalea]MDT0539441.1 DUF3667 domain-containing protein [Croceitalea sp. P059]MDT0621234.1 DUF3667 domain-containing protein [Croceitalea sp. P007]
MEDVPKNKETRLISKGRYELKFRGTACLNCGHILDISDKYCPNCSQANSTKKLVLKDFFDEFFSSLINYDSKLLATLYAMLAKPGSITRDYINGKRIAYTNPFRFLLSLAFLYFLMVSFGGAFSSLDNLNLDKELKKNGPASFSFSNDENEQENDSTASINQLENVFKGLDSLKTSDPAVAKNLKGLDSLEYNIKKWEAKERKSDSLLAANPKNYFEKLESDNADFYDRAEFFFLMLKNDSISDYNEAKEKYSVQGSWKNRMAFNIGNSTLRVSRQPGSWLNDTIAKLPFVIFFFLPIFTIFVYVAYIRKKFTYTDHLIFSFHNQSLLFILLILSWIIDTIFDWSTAGLFLLIFGIYLFQAMRKFYNQGFIKTSIKYLFLNSIFTFLAIITVLLLGIGSAFTY